MQSSSIKCSPTELAGAVKKMLDEHIVLVTDEMFADVIDVGNETVEELKKTSPYERHTKGTRGRHYRNGWKAKADISDGMHLVYTVYNSAKPGLTHLLEHGHGGKHPARAYPHIGPAFNRAKAKLEARMR